MDDILYLSDSVKVVVTMANDYVSHGKGNKKPQIFNEAD